MADLSVAAIYKMTWQLRKQLQLPNTLSHFYLHVQERGICEKDAVFEDFYFKKLKKTKVFRR